MEYGSVANLNRDFVNSIASVERYSDAACFGEVRGKISAIHISHGEIANDDMNGLTDKILSISNAIIKQEYGNDFDITNIDTLQEQTKSKLNKITEGKETFSIRLYAHNPNTPNIERSLMIYIDPKKISPQLNLGLNVTSQAPSRNENGTAFPTLSSRGRRAPSRDENGTAFPTLPSQDRRAPSRNENGTTIDSTRNANNQALDNINRVAPANRVTLGGIVVNTMKLVGVISVIAVIVFESLLANHQSRH